jgi:hypothetical protein
LKPLVLRPAAAADIELSYGVYESRRDGFGDEYLSVLDQALDVLERRPLSAPVVCGETRRQLLERFAQGLFFRLIDDQVVVIACLPVRRGC